MRPDNLSEMGSELAIRARALGELASSAVHPSSPTPLNGPLGPHRRVDWLTLPLDDVRALKHRLGCTINDVVLATVTGAVRHYLMRRGVNPSEIDFRVSAPVSVRAESDKGKLGNHVSTWIVPLPVGESRPQDWVEKIHELTTALKENRQALGLEMMMSAAEYLPPSILALGARSASGPINMIVTNVPGPQFPLYLLGARLLELHPLVPLLDGIGLGIALFSYDGKLHDGLNAEYGLVPDLGAFTALFAQSYLALVDCAAGSAQAKPAEPATAQASGSGAAQASESGTEGAELVDEPAAEVPAASGPVLVSTG
jgi:diacylglycerol O-acyltransferase